MTVSSLYLRVTLVETQTQRHVSAEPRDHDQALKTHTAEYVPAVGSLPR